MADRKQYKAWAKERIREARNNLRIARVLRSVDNLPRTLEKIGCALQQLQWASEHLDQAEACE